ncbi:bacillithiol system redox-active protein YtxJ [Albibacterium sp.]|uniref:bacillithiol system redox-active protein YtxJ n=1 Tax=Albibacterium sp. TaxID=2952885 RepID=UPI002B8BFF13|nr:bacillithiol system redox-active protein YtxJ [Albibacterium sp.]HUH20123.1 bacillithiol system redox-active protein YtxJ [Albibacterium sp.]
MNWIPLDSISQLEDIKKQSEPVLIFKHSTRCPVSSMAKRNLELEAILLPENVQTYFLDLIKFRDISNQIAEIWKIKHESPQALLIYNKECIYNSSHNEISIADIVVKIKELAH